MKTKRLTESEWAVLSALWTAEKHSLGELTELLKPKTNWSRNTVLTYLTRMQAKSLVKIDRTGTKPYSAKVTKEDCAKIERSDLLKNVYNGATGDLISAFLKESQITSEERDRLRKMLDDMEV